MVENAGCVPSLMERLAQLLVEVNPYAGAFRMMRDFEAEERETAENEGRHISEIQMWLHRDSNDDRRRYNAPAANEVAVVIRSCDGEPPFDRDICIHPKFGYHERISILSPNCDPMTYPLLFPHGDKGWQDNIPLEGGRQRQRVTHLQFYSSRMTTRRTFTPILYGGKLFQQYAVDAYCKIEANRLNFIRHNQTQLRAELFSGLMDHINNRALNEGARPGKVIILPSSFQGSPRAMQQNFQ